MRAALAPHLGSEDWQQQSLNQRLSLPVPELARAGHGHIGVRALQPHLTQAQWHSYFKFGVVRDPYDLFVSVCAFLNRNNSDFAENPSAWMLAALNRERFQQRMLVRPQTDMLVDNSGALALDFVGRYEELPAVMANVSLRTGLNDLQLPHRNRSERATAAAYLNQELCATLNEFYTRDFEKLNYPKIDG